TETGRRVLTNNEIGEVEGDVEVFALVRGSSVRTLFQLPILVSGEMGSETAYYLDMSTSFGSPRINMYKDGEYSTLSSAGQLFENNTFYRMLFQRKGSTLRGKVWENGENEPKDWQLEVTDNKISSGK